MTHAAWKRRHPGSYVAELNGIRVALVNMKDGTNSPRWQGAIPAWEVREGGRGDYDIGAKTVKTVWTLAEAKAWAVGHYQRPVIDESDAR